MDLAQFWQLIERTHRESGGVPEQQFERLVQALENGTEADLMQFDYIFKTLMNRAYTTDVWNAAYIITSCGDDSFSDFRAWLIGQGKMAFENVLRNPDSLADIVSVDQVDHLSYESLAYAARKAHWRKTQSKDMPRIYSGFHPFLTGNVSLLDPSEDYQAHYPKLWAKFGWMWKTDEESDASDS
jgi:hypothetical protein